MMSSHLFQPSRLFRPSRRPDHKLGRQLGHVNGYLADDAPAPASLRLQLSALQALCRQTFAVRLALLVIGTPFATANTTDGPPSYAVLTAGVLGTMGSYAMLRDWDRLGPRVLAHPTLMALDLVFGAVLLLTAPPASPLAYATVCTPLLSGLLYGWRGAGVFSGLQLVVLLTVYRAWEHRPGAGASTLLIAGFCVAAGIIGVTLRNLMFRFGTATQALSEATSRLAVAEAVESERARMARELHDSVAKTLHGLVLAAEALATSADGRADPRVLKQQATLVATAARRAAAESRDLLTDLRHHTDFMTSPPTDLMTELTARIEDFTSRTGLAARLRHVSGDGGVAAAGPPELLPRELLPQELLSQETTHHVLSIVSEALENAHRHARATEVVVEAVQDPRAGSVHVRIKDDGMGLPPALTIDKAAGSGHFGLLGMTERAAKIGASLKLTRPATGGTDITLTVPLGSPSASLTSPPPDRRPHMPDQALPGPPPLRVLVADDNPVVRAGLAALLGAHPDIEVVAEATNGEEAIGQARDCRPDVVLLDVRMPGTDGLTALPELAALAPVMMLTYSREPEVVAEALRRGAVGYLVHGEFTAPELITAVRDLRAGRRTLSPSLSGSLSGADSVSSPLGVSYEPSHETHGPSSRLRSIMAQSSKARPVPAAGPHRRIPNRPSFGLSSREVEVMDLIASGMNNRQIAAACFISEKTVKNHINRIFAKLHSSSRSEAIAHWLGTAREGREGWSR